MAVRLLSGLPHERDARCNHPLVVGGEIIYAQKEPDTAGMLVPDDSDLPLTNPGYDMFLSHQVVKETMAVIGSVSSLGAVAGGDFKLAKTVNRTAHVERLR